MSLRTGLWRETPFMIDYAYASGNLLEQPNTYFFSNSGGVAFLRSYIKSRLSVLEFFSEHLFRVDCAGRTPVPLPLVEWMAWNEDGAPAPMPERVALLMKRFAVTKRVWTEYTSVIRPAKGARYDALDLYLCLAECALRTLRHSADLRFLNLCLQAVDILAAHKSEVPGREADRVVEVISLEMGNVIHLHRTSGL